MMKRALPALVMAGMLATAGAGFGETVTVEASVLTGTRTLAVKSLTGGALDSIALGTVGSTGFVADVADVRYDRVGYQVTATLSDLYGYDSDSFDCGRKIDAASFSLGFLTSPTSVTDVGALVDAVWDLAGQLTGTLATLLGVADGTAVTVTGVAAERAEHALDGAFQGIEDTLPIKVGAGSGGAFSAPAPHSACDPSGASSPTARLVMNGNASDLTAMLDWVKNEVLDAADPNDDNAVTASELVSSGSVGDATMAEAVRAGLQAAGVDLVLLDALIADGLVTMDDIYQALTATLRDVTELAGQTGTYLALPKLVASVPGSTPAGTYRGTMTITLVDVP